MIDTGRGMELGSRGSLSNKGAGVALGDAHTIRSMNIRTKDLPVIHIIIHLHR